MWGEPSLEPEPDRQQSPQEREMEDTIDRCREAFIQIRQELFSDQPIDEEWLFEQMDIMAALLDLRLPNKEFTIQRRHNA